MSDEAKNRGTSDATEVVKATEVPYPPSSVGALDERETLERLCNLLSRVWSHFDPYANDPNDCFCHRRTFGPDKFRSSGRPLRWVEDVVIAALEQVTNSATPASAYTQSAPELRTTASAAWTDDQARRYGEIPAHLCNPEPVTSDASLQERGADGALLRDKVTRAGCSRSATRSSQTPRSTPSTR